MLTFAVYAGNDPASMWDLRNAHLMGPDDIGIQAEITFADGKIICDKRTMDAASLVLMVDAGPHGRLLLPTCLLPSREAPYLLFLELTRHRIKIFLNKLEDWMLYELDPDHPVMTLWQEARDRFTEAVIMEPTDPAKAQVISQEALEMALRAGDHLAILHADILLAKRYANKLMPDDALGCRVHPEKFAEPLAKILINDFDFISIPLHWSELEPEEGQYDWSKLDRWMNWAASMNLPVVAGPIVDFRSVSVPEWLYIWEHDYDTTHDLLHEHIEAIVSRYKSVVSVWNVASSLHINTNFTLAYDELMDLTRMATSLVKSLHPSSTTMIEITEPFGEYFTANPKSVPPVIYAETIAQSGFKVDMIGINIQTGHHKDGRAVRDLMQLSSLLDRLIYLEMPVAITGLGAPSQRPKMEEADPAGYWREPWSPAQQSEWLTKAIAIGLSKPFVESVCVHEFYDHQSSELPGAGLITANGRGKPALERMGQVHTELRKGTFRCSKPEERIWTDAQTPEDADVIR